jgi:hypothetical protein
MCAIQQRGQVPGGLHAVLRAVGSFIPPSTGAVIYADFAVACHGWCDTTGAESTRPSSLFAGVLRLRRAGRLVRRAEGLRARRAFFATTHTQRHYSSASDRRPGPRGEQRRGHGYRGCEGCGGCGGPGGRTRGRAQRGEVRRAILLLLSAEPVHGFQIMQSMSDRAGGAWHPSLGAIYPTIAQVEDEGLVTTREEGGRRLVALRGRGRRHTGDCI